MQKLPPAGLIALDRAVEYQLIEAYENVCHGLFVVLNTESRNMNNTWKTWNTWITVPCIDIGSMLSKCGGRESKYMKDMTHLCW